MNSIYQKNDVPHKHTNMFHNDGDFLPHPFVNDMVGNDNDNWSRNEP